MDIGERQRKLSEWSMQRLTNPDHGLFASRKDLRLYDLYHLVYEPTWLRAAHDRVARNTGSKTAGCDGINMLAFDRNLEENLRKLADDLRAQTFEPQPVRRVYIPKKNGKMRPLGIPSIRDRIVQESLRMVLEPIFEAEFYRHSHGFRPNRATRDALAAITHYADNESRYFWVIEGDIKSYFDTIHHRKLMELLRRRIRDKKLLRLVWLFLKAGVMEGNLFKRTEAGTPQGGIISPLLANVYLHELDMHMQRLAFNQQIRRLRRKAGKPNFAHIRYADDFVVMCNGTKADAEAMRQELTRFLSQELKLTLSEEKTKVTHVNDGFQFLGFNIRRSMSGNGVMWPKHTIPAEAEKKFRGKVMEITSPSSCRHSISTKLTALNSLLRGWGNYYRTTYCVSRKYPKLDYFVFWRFAHWLGTKFRIRMPTVLRRFNRRVNGVMALATDSAALFQLRSLEYSRLMKRKFCNPYSSPQPQLVSEELFGLDNQWSGNEARPGMQDLRPQVFARDRWTCRHCGRRVSYASGHVDHVRPVKRFKRPLDAQRMENLQTLCISCHNQKTTNERD